ncbi:MAG: ATP synthase subunit C [Treponema sp.]|nr:ATP synthase subunit C [Treponema sp.]
MKKIILLLCVMVISGAGGAVLFAQDHASDAQASADSIKAVAAGIAVGLSCIAGGIAVGRIGAAAMGAMSENSDLFGKALPLVGLAEGICLWGFLVALLILFL